MFGFGVGTTWIRRWGWLGEAAVIAAVVVVVVSWAPVRDVAQRVTVLARAATSAVSTTADTRDDRADTLLALHADYAASAVRDRGLDPIVVVEIIEVRSTSRGEREYAIDAGSLDGLRPGDPVVFGDSLVGLVHSVDADRSWCLGAASPAHRFAATLHASVARSRERVLEFAVAGSHREAGCLDLRIFREWDAFEGGGGLPIATASRADSQVPAGLRLGTARRLRDRSGNPLRDAVIEPDVRFDSILAAAVVASGDTTRADRRAAWRPVEATLSHAADPVRARASGILDRGARDGVRRGAAVSMGGTWIGIVDRVAGRTSRVRFAADPGVRVDAIGFEDAGPGVPFALEGVGLLARRGHVRSSVARSELARASDADGWTWVTRPGREAVPGGLRLSTAMVATSLRNADGIASAPLPAAGRVATIWVPRLDRQEARP